MKRIMKIVIVLLILLIIVDGIYNNIDRKKEIIYNNVDYNTNDPVVGETILGVQPKNLIGINEIIDEISKSDKKIIYIGEEHDSYLDHVVQLEIIKALYEKGHKIAIGMEIFERPSQNIIDDYMSGNITEKQFLKNIQWYKRVQNDYNLYKEIIDFAKENNLKIVAINMKQEIVKNVSKVGLENLSDEDKKEIPEGILKNLYMSNSDNDYRNLTKEIFEYDVHKNNSNNSNDELYFYQSQILRDEIIAYSIDEFLNQSRYDKFIILTGNLHITYGYGVPKRTIRKDYITLVQNYIDKNIGDFILIPRLGKDITLESTPKLGIVLNQDNEKVKIIKVNNNSIAEKAGLKENDILLIIDDLKIEDVEDIRIAVFDKRKGDTIKVNILRTGKEIEFIVNLSE